MRRAASRVAALLRPTAALGLLALAPKCVLCLAAYAGVGAWLGIRTPEICGATGSRPAWQAAVWGLVMAVGVTGWVANRRLRARGGGPPPSPGNPPSSPSAPQSFKPLRSRIRGVHFSTRASRVADCLAPEMKRM